MFSKYILLLTATISIIAGVLFFWVSSQKKIASDLQRGGENAPIRAAPKNGQANTDSKLFLQCRACHTLDASGSNGSGPNLYGIIGRKAGSHPGYDYSAVLFKSDIIWTPKNLDAFLAKPNTFLPGSKMAFGGINSAAMRRDLIAYLEKHSDN